MHPFWSQLFGNERSVEIEVGSGTGTFLLPAARSNPAVNFLGIERSHRRAMHLAAAIQADRLGNVILLNADATCIIDHLIPDGSVAAYHVYFPDPWWKRRHQRRRLFTAQLAKALARTLVPGGRLYVATDVDLVFDLVIATVAAESSLHRDPSLRSPRSGQTVFERKGLRRGAVIHDVGFVKAAGATPGT